MDQPEQWMNGTPAASPVGEPVHPGEPFEWRQGAAAVLNPGVEVHAIANARRRISGEAGGWATAIAARARELERRAASLDPQPGSRS